MGILKISRSNLSSLIILLFCIFFSPNLISKPVSFLKIVKNLKSIKSPTIYRNFDKICESIEIYKGNPGFDKVLDQLDIFLKHPQFKNNPSLALGIIYEITESLELAKEKRAPKKFQVALNCSLKNITRIIDAQNKEEFFEYKNIFI